MNLKKSEHELTAEILRGPRNQRFESNRTSRQSRDLLEPTNLFGCRERERNRKRKPSPKFPLPFVCVSQQTNGKDQEIA